MATPPKPPIVDASTGTVNPADKARFEAEVAQYKADVQKELNVQCPLDSEYKIGKNWYETH